MTGKLGPTYKFAKVRPLSLDSISPIPVHLSKRLRKNPKSLTDLTDGCFHRDLFEKLLVAFHENQQFARFETKSNPSYKERQNCRLLIFFAWFS